VLGFTQISSITFAYFVLGLLGSTLVDLVIENRTIISMWIIRKGVGKIDDPPTIHSVEAHHEHETPKPDGEK
jgi:hypothetical protein